MTAPFVFLLPDLATEAEAFWESANKKVRWGWKRDEGGSSRLIYYSGRLTRRGSAVGVTDQFVLYVHRTDARTASRIADLLTDAEGPLQAAFGPLEVRLRSEQGGHATIRVVAGSPGQADAGLTERLRRRRPRRAIAPVPDLAPRELEDMHALFPADLYLGSGVSYEAGLPTLCDMHDVFSVDDATGTRFATGADDRLPDRLTADPPGTIAAFCQVHTGALTAEPTAAMHVVAGLHASGLVGEIYTDNVDNLIAKVDVPFIRTRGSGVLNERCHVRVPSPRLIVVGVAADRREVIAQARARRRRIVVVNPCLRVAPHVRHLTYLRPGDLFYKTTADLFFARLADAVDLVPPMAVAT